ncbi:MAG: choice-of-anchor I family protein, partial [Actinomycetia bacterium]|nr:choice-of-anchor I family protein [Actinomycetes bacterium]
MSRPPVPSRSFRIACVTAAAGALCAGALVAAPAAVADEPAIAVSLQGTYATGIFDQSAAEIPAFDPITEQLFVVNAQSGLADVLSLGADGVPGKIGELSAAGRLAADGSTVDEGAVVNSVAIANGIVALAVEADDKVQHGWALFFTTDDLTYLGGVRIGSLPDGLAFSPDGRFVVVANEGEPADDFSTDPEGTISVISVPADAAGFADFSQDNVRTVDFRHFDEGTPLPEGVRVFGPDVPTPAGHEDAGYIARNLEPEYVVINASGTAAYVSVQEANAIAVVDLASATLSDLWALEIMDWSVDGRLDASDRDDAVNLQHWPIFGVPMPDGLGTYVVGGVDHVVTANEGDAREWGDYVDSVRAKNLTLCAEEFPNAAELLADENLGRLNVLSDLGYDEARECHHELYALGSRGFSIYTAAGERVFDSGGQFEEIIAGLIESGDLPPEAFNSNHSEQPSDDNRSDDKGVEPEGVAIGTVGGRTYAFVGLERIGGFMIYDVTDPAGSFFVDYVNNRDFSAVYEDEDGDWQAAGDLGAEGLIFVPAADSPTGEALVIVANEVSGTTSVFSVTALAPEPTQE